MPKYTDMTLVHRLSPPVRCLATLRMVCAVGHPRLLESLCAVLATLTLSIWACAGAVSDALVGLDSLPTAVDVGCRERFLKEAPLAWRAARQRLRGFELELTYSEHEPDAPRQSPSKPKTSIYCVLSDGTSRRLTRDDKVDITNSEYGFTVARPGDAYFLSDCQLWQAGAQQPLIGWLDIAESNLAMGFNAWWLPMEKMLANPAFVMTGAECGVSKEGDEIVRIVYRYTGKEVPNEFYLEPGGVYWAEMCPARHWVAVRSGITSSEFGGSGNSPFQAIVTTRFQEWDGAPLPEEVKVVSRNPQTGVVLRVQENRFGTPRACTRPIEEFFLTHYGISESSIPRLEGKLGRRRLAILVTSIAVLILAWLVYKQSKKAYVLS